MSLPLSVKARVYELACEFIKSVDVSTPVDPVKPVKPVEPTLP